MAQAVYLCTGSTDNIEDFYHYAHHIPAYTHFTSPFKSYADIVVHRLLAASLGYSKRRQWKVKELSTIASKCNKQKCSAKCAEQASIELYLAHYSDEHEPFIQDAIVFCIGNSFFDVLIITTGSIIRMNPKKLNEKVKYIRKQDEAQQQLTIIFPETSEFPEEHCTIALLSILKVNLQRISNTTKLEAVLVRPVVNWRLLK